MSATKLFDQIFDRMKTLKPDFQNYEIVNSVLQKRISIIVTAKPPVQNPRSRHKISGSFLNLKFLENKNIEQ